MHPYNDQFRDLRNLNTIRAVFDRNPPINGHWSNGHYLYPIASRRPSAYHHVPFCQPAPRSLFGPLKQTSTGLPNVSTHSTVRWLNNSIEMFGPWKDTRVYSRPRTLTTVSKQSFKSTPTSGSNKPSVAKNNTDTKPKVLDESVETKPQSSNHDIDVTDGPCEPASPDPTLIPIPPWLKPNNTLMNNELKPVDGISPVIDPDQEIDASLVQLVQSIEAKMDNSSGMEDVEQSTTQTTEPIPGTWSSVLEELQTSEQSEQKRQRNRGVASTKRGRRRRKPRNGMCRKMQRAIQKISIGEGTTNVSASSNIYTNYVLAQQSRHLRGANYITHMARTSFPNYSTPPLLLQQAYGPYRANPWNASTSSSANFLTPRIFNSGSRPRFPFIQQRAGFNPYKWSKTSSTSTCNERNKHTVQNTTSLVSSSSAILSKEGEKPSSL